MNIYKFEHKGGEADWVCAPTIKKARDFYESHICGKIEDDVEVSKMLKKDLSRSYILDISEDEPDWEEYDGDLTEDDFCNGYRIIESFEEYLKTGKYTDIVATTEY